MNPPLLTSTLLLIVWTVAACSGSERTWGCGGSDRPKRSQAPSHACFDPAKAEEAPPALGRTHDNADGVFNTGFADAGDNLFRKFNNWTDVTIRSGENGLFFEHEAWDDAVQDLDWRTGWKDDECYYDHFRDRPPLCEP